jgi:hypothetical protein
MPTTTGYILGSRYLVSKNGSVVEAEEEVLVEEEKKAG